MKEYQLQIPDLSFQPTANDALKKGALSRRRAIVLFGCAAGLPSIAVGNAFAAAHEGISLYRWDGSALGAQAKLTLAHQLTHSPQRNSETQNINFQSIFDILYK